MFKRKRITVLGVSLLAALGLMSISAAGAQAGQWTIDGKAVSKSASFASAGGPVTISGGGLQFECAEQLGAGTLWGGEGKASLILSGCVALGAEEACLFGEENIYLDAKMTLSKDGSQVVFQPADSSSFGQFTMINVENECMLIEGGSEQVTLSGSFTASAGSDAVELPLSIIPSSSFFVGLPGMHSSEVEGSSSMWLTGANAGKVLGAS